MYRRLIECLQSIQLIAETTGLGIANLETTEADIEATRPSDVYDISSLIVAELAYLYQQAGFLDAPRPAYSRGRKLPSDVYQRAGQLKVQLDELQGLVNTRPDWLQRSAAQK